MFPLTTPEDHTKDYDRAIQMVEWSIEDTIELDTRQFQQLVMDEWEWKERFDTQIAAYKMKVVR